MESFSALVFEDPDALAETLGGWPHEGFLRAPCRVLRAEDPDGGDGVWVVSSDALGRGTRRSAPVEVRREGGHLLPGDGRRLAIVQEEEFSTPLLAVPPAPWGEEPDFRGVAALCRDDAAYRSALSACLTLGQEALRAARLDDGVVALFVEDPSYFLVQTWHEEEHARVYWRGRHPQLFLPWGLEHPLSRRLTGFEAGDAYFFAEPEGGWRRFPAVAAEDVYGSLVLDLSGRVERALEPEGELPRVEVALRWGFRPRPGEPSLWLLPEPGDAQVDALVARLPEAELQTLQVAILERGDEAALFAVRRLSTGAAGRAAPPEVPGEGFAPYAGYGNLLLPTDRLFEPPIRKDRYRSMLGLVPGEVVLVRPHGGGERDEEEGMQVLRFPERAFRPLPSLVDYRVARSEERLEEIVRSAVFDFEHLELAPERAREAPPPRRERPVRPGGPEDDEAAAAPGEEPEEEDAPAEEPASAPRAPSRAPTRRVVDEPAAPIEGPDVRELELETEALDSGAPELWAELAARKRALGKPREALFAAEEALWRAGGDDGAVAERRAALVQHLSEALEVAADDPDRRAAVAAAVTGGGEARDRAALYLALTLRELSEGEELRGGLAEAYAALRGARLRSKSRWMGWCEVLSRSRDEAEEERQREQILGSLSRRGLEPEDRPPFLGRYLRSRVGLEEWSEQADLPALLDLLGEAAMTIPAGPFRMEAQTLVHRTRLEAEREGRERGIVEELRTLVGKVDDPDPVSLANLGGALSHLTAEDGVAVFHRLFQRIRETRENELQDRVFQYLFRNLVFAERFTGAQTVVQGSVEVLRELSPARRCRVLAEVAGDLVELGARQEAVQLARELLEQREVQDDLYFVERAMVALRAALGPDPVPDEVWEAVGASIADSDERFDPLYLDLVEDTAAALGEPFLGRLEGRLGQKGAGGTYEALVLGACRMRVLAETGRAGEGLDAVEGALRACWSLPKIPEQARALTRYVRAIAHFGNVERGTALLGEVVRAAHEKDAKDLDHFYRAEILGEVARAAGDLADPDRAVEILESILDGVQARLEGGRDDAALLFEVLSIGIEVLLDLAEWSAGGPLVERVEAVISKRVARESGVHRGPLFFLHRGRVVCARALLYMGREEAGTRALLDALDGFQVVSALDRPDLLKETARVLPFIDGAVRREALAKIVDLMRKMEDYGEYDRRCRSEVVHALGDAVRPGADAFRREQNRWDALEAKDIRRRVARARPARGGDAA